MTDKAGTDRPSLPRMTKPSEPSKPPRLAGFGPSTPEPDPEPPPTPKAKATKPKTTKPKAKAAAETDAAAPATRTEPDHEPRPNVVRTGTRLPRSLAKRVRSAARAQNVGRARLLLVAYLEHEDDLPLLLHPDKPRDDKYASVGVKPDLLAVAEPTEHVTWDFPALGKARLDETCQQHGVTRSALIRALLEAAYPEQKEPGPSPTSG